ncbi:hypothetical protein [Streptomyces sp. NRRL F-5135]|uniref:hypothetical protein n=1 Tax=Streptomyces sp. NRRL F-5135 TaxID=1463858 RepID=UPI0005644122|nr:hypothetical protein [Streptomyces sp. NRRL F-5135]
MKNGAPWVGDQVRDEATGRTAIITDVQSGRYVLRALHGVCQWTALEAARLTVTEPLPDPYAPTPAPQR